MIGNPTISIEGNGCRPSHLGAAISDEGVMYTLNATEVHIVAYPEEEAKPLACFAQNAMDSRVTEIRDDVCSTLTSRIGSGGPSAPLVVEVFENREMAARVRKVEVAPTIVSANNGIGIIVQEKDMSRYVVRRITPTECERLQGFPTKGEIGPGGKVMERDYTDIPWDKSEHAPDSHRYKALGNSMTTTVMKWIGESIMYALEHPITEDTSENVSYQQDLFGGF